MLASLVPSGVESDDGASLEELAAPVAMSGRPGSTQHASHVREHLDALSRGAQGSLLATVGGVAMATCCNGPSDATTRSQLRQEEDVRSAVLTHHSLRDV